MRPYISRGYVTYSLGLPTLRCNLVGCMYCPNVTQSTPALLKSVEEKTPPKPYHICYMEYTHIPGLPNFWDETGWGKYTYIISGMLDHDRNLNFPESKSKIQDDEDCITKTSIVFG